MKNFPDHLTSAPAVNSREWWETYFAEQWGQNHGSQQTRHFMERLTTSLDNAVIRFLRSQPLDIVDWGCAFGEGVEWLAQSFPYSRVIGLDYAARAIDEARRLHPEREFIHATDGVLPRTFDVIVTSNCLEHFEAPLEIVKAQLPLCRWLYIALVPYDESPLCEFHLTQFRQESFPEKLGTFTRLSARVIDVDRSCWPGQQLLVVYGSPEYLAQRDNPAPHADEQEKWDRYYADLPLLPADEASEAFHQELTQLISDLLPRGSTTLEAGCGGGWQSLALAKAGYQPTLLDFSPGALDYARRLFAREAQSAQFHLGDALAPGKPEYDFVFNAGVLEHYTLEEQATFLRAMASRSRKYVLVLVPNRACYWYWLWRIEHAGRGNWPYGKEMPLTDLSEAFRMAGLRFLGQACLGAAWTESFIANLPGLSLELAQSITNIHRSPLIPQAEKSYLLAALGTVEETQQSVPAPWVTSTTVHNHKLDELTGAMADALALSVRQENELRQKEQTIRTLTARNRQLTQTSGPSAHPAHYAAVVAERDQAIRQHEQARQELFEIQTSNYWKALGYYWKLRNWLRRQPATPRSADARIPAPPASTQKVSEEEESEAHPAAASVAPPSRVEITPATLNEPAPQNHREQLARVMKQIAQSKGAVILLPSVGWNIVLFQRPHHLARAFAQRGYVAIFDCNFTDDDVDGFREIEPGLYLFKGPTNLLAEIPRPLLWAFTYNFAQREQYPAGTPIIYDWIDDLEVFSHDQQFLAEQHEIALREASVVTSSALRLHRQALAVRRDAVYLPNGVEVQRFSDDQVSLPDDPALADWFSSARPLAGYYGALASWFDYDLLEAVARQRPDWNFVLIGPNYDDSLTQHSILNCPNVRWIGPRNYVTLPGYLKRFDVAMIPFLINDITLATSPLKLYEYFAGGKPVITTPMPECMAFAEVRIARNADEFAAALDEARKQQEDSSFRARLRAIAEKHSWQQRVTEAMRAYLRPARGIEQITLSDAALAVAEQFQRHRTADNQRFFAALSEYFSHLTDNACLPMYFEFAITSNQRGRQVVESLRRHCDPVGKKYLDVGCAYGGFLVAFAEAGASVAGFDISESLLKLARQNLLDCAVNAPLLHRDATRHEDITEFINRCDIITCNDVIEHVTDPQALLRNVAAMLREGGLAYFEIPNGEAASFVLQDGHYQLYGITLLDYPDATRYYNSIHPTGTHDVYTYLSLEAYAALFRQAGLEITVLDESLMHVSEDSVKRDLTMLRQTMAEKLRTVPDSARELVRQKVEAYLATVKNTPLSAAAEKRDFLMRYGATFWKVIARKAA